MKELYKEPIHQKQNTDSGMALVLLLLLIGAFTHQNLFFLIAIPVLAMNMIYPNFYYPWARFWLGTTKLLGTIVSKTLLVVIYLLFVLPVGLVRKATGKDPLMIRRYRDGEGSVMVTRNKVFTRGDLEKPF